ncbi:MAG: substrate-binding domain-containing protein [Tepidisphaeraceae bacterium]
MVERLLEGIHSGSFAPGDKLPTETELARLFSASRSTVARAMRELKNRGLLNRRRGGGTSIARSSAKEVALFTPFARTAGNLGYIGDQIHAHLSDVACRGRSHLRLQLVPRSDDVRLEPILGATKSLIDEGVQGVFFYPHELAPEQAHFNRIVAEKLTEVGVAVVCIDRDITTFPERSNYPLVTFDNRRGGYLITQHLIQRGCKRIAFLTTPHISSAAADRVRGYRDAMEDAGMHLDRSFVRAARFHDINFEFCKSMMDDLKPDAIVCKMDHYAALVGRHLTTLGVSIGKDVRLAGFDNQPIAEMLPVPLTTIRFPADAFATVAYSRLIEQMASPKELLAGATYIDVELIVRESTGA